MRGAKEQTVYEPRSHVGWAPRVWRAMACQFWDSRELAWRLFVRDLTARYRQTLLGAAWVVLTPLAMVLVFVFLRNSGVLTLGEMPVPYPLFAIIGLTIWQLFATGLHLCTNAMISGGSMVVKINFPKETLIAAAFGLSLVDFLVRVVFIAILLMWYHVPVTWNALFFPVSVLPLALFTLGLGFFLALLTSLARDVSNIVSAGLTLLLFATPVLYPEPPTRTFQIITVLNPLSPLVNAPRDLIVYGSIRDGEPFATASVLALMVFLLGWRTFGIAQVRMAERMGAR